MIHKTVARSLTRAQRELLIEHVDGSRTVEVLVFAGKKIGAMKSLIGNALIRPDRRDKPRKTTITDDGRQVLAYVLAEYADALVKAGCVGIATPIIPARAALVPNDDPDQVIESA